MSAKVINLNKRLGRLVETKPPKLPEVRRITIKPYESETAEVVFLEKYGETMEVFRERLKEKGEDEGFSILTTIIVRPEDVYWDKEKQKHIYKTIED